MCIFSGNPFVSFLVELYWHPVSLWQPFIMSETFGANFQEQNSHQFSVLGILVNTAPKIVSCFRWSKRMQSCPLIVVVVMNSWPIQQCKKLLDETSFYMFYSLLCAETSTNKLPCGINYSADHPSVFREISSLNGLYTISMCLMEMGPKTIWVVY